MELHISVYSVAIVSSTQFKELKTALLVPQAQNRAGADAEVAIVAMIERLQQRYRQVYTSQAINWRIWANYVLAGPPHEQDICFDAGPPGHLIHLFAAAGVDEGQLRRQIVQSNRVAIGENERMREWFRNLRQRVGILIQTAQALEGELNAIQDELEIRGNMLRDMETSIQPVVQPHALQLLANVSQQEDIDHAPPAGGM
ncbi:hypothetical protein BDR26DRAFT_896536 [Obelidium mucronatum]|nr:hypothetical protein BDR26DRAFT_896536 [Obelidium mucronatum]